MKKLNYLLLFSLLPFLAFGQMKTKSIAIFKNGQSFVMKSGKVSTPEGNYVMKRDLPNALFGTLWFDAPNTEITSIASYQDSVMTKREQTIASHANLLQRNIGKEVKIVMNTEVGESAYIYKGKVEKVYPRGDNQSIIVLNDDNNKWHTIKEVDIMQVMFSEAPNYDFSIDIPELKPIIELEFENKAAAQDLDMMYLQNGLKWMPQYLLNLEAENKGSLILQAEIANDVEDIENVPVDFVVGVPNFKYATRNAYLVDFLNHIGTAGNRNQFNQLNFSNSVVSYGVEAAPTDPINDASSVEGSENEDLFFYNIPSLTLPKGGRAVKNLFRESVKLSHVYETNLTANGENHRNYQQASLVAQTPQNPVSHVVKIENTTDQPWTSAPILVMNEQGSKRPISQDLMKYTASGSNAFVKLTETPDIKITHTEKQIETKPNAKRWRNNNYTLYKVSGQIKVQSFKKKAVDLNVRRQITGTLLKTSKDWLKGELVNLSSPNEKNNVCWELKVPAKGKMTIDYEYEIYVYR